MRKDCSGVQGTCGWECKPMPRRIGDFSCRRFLLVNTSHGSLYSAVKKTIFTVLSFSIALPAIAAPAALTKPVGFIDGSGRPAVALTTPVGMNSEHLRPGMNMIGLRLHQAVITSGRVGELGDDFAELTGVKADENGKPLFSLKEGTTYVLEITSGAQAGVIQEITRWQGLRLTLPDNLSAAGVKTGDGFSLRKAATLNSVFDPRLRHLKSGTDATTADVVLIPQGASFGDFRQCFILQTPEIPATWVDAATIQPLGDLPLVYPDGLIVRINGPAPVDITFSGETKPGPTRSVVKLGLNLVATPYPATDGLQDLGLENDLTKSDNPMEADHVWIADDAPSGAFVTY